MSQLTERMARNFIRGFNEAFGELECDLNQFTTAAHAVLQYHKDHIAGIHMSGETSMTLVVGNRTAWFDDNWELCGPPELLQSLVIELERKAAEERRVKQPAQPKPAMDMSLLSVHEED